MGVSVDEKGDIEVIEGEGGEGSSSRWTCGKLYTPQPSGLTAPLYTLYIPYLCVRRRVQPRSKVLRRVKYM